MAETKDGKDEDINKSLNLIKSLHEKITMILRSLINKEKL
jgi:hypothetical protein